MSSRPTSVGDNNQSVIEIVPQIKVLNFQQVLEVFETSLLCDFDSNKKSCSGLPLGGSELLLASLCCSWAPLNYSGLLCQA